MQLGAVPEHLPPIREQTGWNRLVTDAPASSFSRRPSLSSLQGSQFGMVGLDRAGPP